MSSTTNFDFNDILALQALSSPDQAGESDFDDDDDDESMYDIYPDIDDDDDDDEGFGDADYLDDDDDDSAYLGDAYSDDDGESASPEFISRRLRRRMMRRRRRYRGKAVRRSRKVRGAASTTLMSRSGKQMRVRLGKRFATAADVNRFIKDVDRKFALAMKERKTNHDRLSRQISTNSKVLNSKVNRLRKTVKQLQQQAQTSSLLGLLQGAPKVEAIQLQDKDSVKATDIDDVSKADVTFEKPDMMLPLILSGGLGGSGSGGGSNMMLLALAMQSKK